MKSSHGQCQRYTCALCFEFTGLAGLCPSSMLHFLICLKINGKCGAGGGSQQVTQQAKETAKESSTLRADGNKVPQPFWGGKSPVLTETVLLEATCSGRGIYHLRDKRGLCLTGPYSKNRCFMAALDLFGL